MKPGARFQNLGKVESTVNNEKFVCVHCGLACRSFLCWQRHVDKWHWSEGTK